MAKRTTTSAVGGAGMIVLSVIMLSIRRRLGNDGDGGENTAHQLEHLACAFYATVVVVPVILGRRLGRVMRQVRWLNCASCRNTAMGMDGR